MVKSLLGSSHYREKEQQGYFIEILSIFQQLAPLGTREQRGGW
jgi:hypothetical protein